MLAAVAVVGYEQEPLLPRRLPGSGGILESLVDNRIGFIGACDRYASDRNGEFIAPHVGSAAIGEHSHEVVGAESLVVRQR